VADAGGWTEPKHYEDILDFIGDNAGPNPTKRKLILDIGGQLLNKTGHIPIVTNVSRGAGFCSYYARLSEAIGVKKLWGHLADRVAGKGNDVHKIMGVASLRFFGGKLSPETVIEVVDEAANEFEGQLRQPDIDKGIAKTLFSNLLGELPRMAQITGIDLDHAFPVVEQQFMDYALHLRGTPDLILEDAEHQKAIVVDWKTGTDTPGEAESSQVIAYGLMEGRRLGLSKKEAVDAILGHPSVDASGKMTGVSDISILPVIVRPTQRASLRPHPVLFAKPEELQSRWEAFRNLTFDTLVEAQHLSLLLTNQYELTGVKDEETKVEMTIQGKTQKLNLLRYTPRQLGRGKPSVQRNFPCRTRTGAAFCNLIEPCRYYFGRNFAEQDQYENAMWSLRFKIFNINERDLLLYRAIFDTFENYGKEEVIAKLQAGEGIRVSIGHAPMFDPKLKMRLAAVRDDARNRYSDEFRMDLIDKLEPEGKYQLVGTRAVREFEKTSRRYRVVNEGKPVLLSSVDSGAPLLSIGVFARVDEIEPGEHQIKYHFRAPSKILNYQSMLFQEYLKLNPKIGHNMLMFEANVDLTQMELGAIDALQRALHDVNPAAAGVSADELRRELTFTEETEGEMKEDSEEQTLEEKLKQIIGKGTSHPVQDK
jgi:PD-(D/E)XK nuclease superfamily